MTGKILTQWIHGLMVLGHVCGVASRRVAYENTQVGSRQTTASCTARRGQPAQSRTAGSDPLMADDQTTSAAKARRRGFGSKLFVSICVALLTVLVLAFFVLSSGEVTGHEFCPETFSLRSVSYFQLPVVHVQVTPVIRTDQSTNPLLAHIRGQPSWSEKRPTGRLGPGLRHGCRL